MGFIYHAAIIADYPSLGDARLGEPWKGRREKADADLAAFRESLPENWRPLVIGPVEAVVNGYAWLAFLPDGSKEGWEDSDLGDEYQERFRALFGGLTARWGDADPVIELGDDHHG